MSRGEGDDHFVDALEKWASHVRQTLRDRDKEDELELRMRLVHKEEELERLQLAEKRWAESGTPRYFAWLAILTPKRIWTEDVGDALETIAAMRSAGCSNLKVRAKVISTYFWVLIAVLRELVAALTGRKSPHR